LQNHPVNIFLEKNSKINSKMAVRVINDEGHFQAELVAAGVKLVVVDFTAQW
jgi:hypothetical protein